MKMFKIYFSFFLICFALHSKAQINLVTNPSFEDTIQCPSNINQMNLAVGWSPFRGTPDYLNACNMTSVGIPSNGFGFQYARTGNGYAGFLSFYKPGIDQREIIGTELKQPLDVGIKYFVSFYICLAKNMLSQINIASNKTGLKFSTIQYNLNNPVPIDNISQIYTDSIITDSINWSKISGSFVADSNYKYVSFGNFFTDSQTSTISFDSSAYFAHYFIDDIRISTDSIYVNGVRNTETLIVYSVSPNPAKEKVKISAAQIKSIFFNDILGNALYKSNLNLVSSTEIDVSLFPNGIYLLKIETINFSQTIKLIVQK